MGITTLLLLHSGIGDARQWHPQVARWGGRFRLVVPELRVEPVPLEPAVVVGSSFGGRLAMELAVERPDLVEALVLVAPGLPGHEVSAELDAVGEREQQLVEAGELDAAAELMVQTWVPGADDEVRGYVREAQRRAYSLPPPTHLRFLDPPLEGRLGEVRAPVLLVEGELDQPDFHRIADRLERELLDVRGRVTIPGAHHLPNLERPEEFDAAVLPFLEQVGA